MAHLRREVRATSGQYPRKPVKDSKKVLTERHDSLITCVSITVLARERLLRMLRDIRITRDLRIVGPYTQTMCVSITFLTFKMCVCRFNKKCCYVAARVVVVVIVIIIIIIIIGPSK